MLDKNNESANLFCLGNANCAARNVSNSMGILPYGNVNTIKYCENEHINYREHDQMNSTEDILGYQVSNLNKDAFMQEIIWGINQPNSSQFFACANPHSIQVAETDTVFKQALRGADLLTPDGIGILFASKILGGSIRERVTGSDIFADVNAVLNERGGCSCFFIGSTEKVLADIKAKMAVEYPNFKVAGTYSPPFKTEFSEKENEEMRQAINAVKPDVLWVGMTAPKQEKWICQNRDQLDVKFIAAIGAVFDFYIGRVKRPPPVYRNLGLEWLARLLQEPKRLWRRNFVSNPKFMLRVIRQRLTR